MWKAKPWKELTRDELHGLIRLRVDVFVVEQDGAYSDVDGKDLRAWHVWAESVDASKGMPMLACARVLGPGVSYAEPSIGRVATRRDRRSEGLGKELMKQSIDVCDRTWPGHNIRISAQCYLESWYGELGFVSVGEPYLEDGIPHIQMLRSASV
ncbi:MAG: GNAT family N-acetyltransferase [Bacteroidota bacterium]|nr:GNAT family N-acetyltransferase [Bacteroidota bacterium]